MVNIIYVDKDDNEVGSGPAGEAHEKGIIHRTIRIYLYNAKGELLMQKRADHLKSNPGKWTESVAGHVDVGETYREAADREMLEELGISGVDLLEVKKVYTEEKDAHKLKKRFTMLYKGSYDGEVHPDPSEVGRVEWMTPESLREQIARHPELFSNGTLQCLAQL